MFFLFYKLLIIVTLQYGINYLIISKVLNIN